MPRRRSASPRSSGPVRRSSPPARAAPPPPTSTPMPPQQRQPGLLGQMAATAGGVAIGSAVVCTERLENFISIFGTVGTRRWQHVHWWFTFRGDCSTTASCFGHGWETAATTLRVWMAPIRWMVWNIYIDKYIKATYIQNLLTPLSFCSTQGQKDVSLCQGFNEIFKDCKTRYGQGQ